MAGGGTHWPVSHTLDIHPQLGVEPSVCIFCGANAGAALVGHQFDEAVMTRRSVGTNAWAALGAVAAARPHAFDGASDADPAGCFVWALAARLGL